MHLKLLYYNIKYCNLKTKLNTILFGKQANNYYDDSNIIYNTCNLVKECIVGPTLPLTREIILYYTTVFEQRERREQRMRQSTILLFYTVEVQTSLRPAIKQSVKLIEWYKKKLNIFVIYITTDVIIPYCFAHN